LLSAPSAEEHPAILADWLELQALSSANRQARILSISDIKDITQDAEAEDVADFDAETDGLIGRVTAEILRRATALSNAYPFQVNESGTLLTWTEPSTVGGTVYLFCLLMCHVSKSCLLDSNDLSAEAREGRNLFQICATLAAAGLCQGPSFSFGWPRADGTTFSEKLREVYAVFGDGTPRAVPLAAAPQAIKDGGIDVISWRPTPDGLPGTFYVLGQVASGNNWAEKTVLKDIEKFHWAWFDVAPATPVQGAMFVPFCITDSPEVGGDYDEQEFLVSRMQFIAKEFGHFVYRYRLPILAHSARRLADEGVTPIEGLDRLANISDWIEAFVRRLQGQVPQ
jgi:hypothetical protein